MNLKSPSEIELMREGGRITGQALEKVISAAQPGVSLLELDQIAESMIVSAGATPSFKSVPSYHYTTCLNVNEGVVHGVPTKYTLRSGDVLSVDLGVYHRGFHTDAAWTVIVDERGGNPTLNAFLSCGENALSKAIVLCKKGNYLEDISRVIQETVEGSGYSVSRDLVGHGVGRELHEDPQVPGFVDENQPSLRLEDGMVLAIEIIYMQGKSPIVESPKDGWTISTADGSIAALFEHTVALTAEGPVVLTRW